MCHYSRQEWSRNYYRIVNRFENIIRAQFFGHTHFDHFEVFYENLRPTSVAYISPSVTTFPHENSAFSVFTVDGFHPNSSFVSWFLTRFTFAENIPSPWISSTCTIRFSFTGNPRQRSLCP